MREPDQPYYAGYTLRGLYDVMHTTTSWQEQYDAVPRLLARMELLGHDSLFLEQGALTRKEGRMSIVDVLGYAHAPILARRGSPPYEALLAALPRDEMRERIRPSVDTIVVHPDVRSSLDGSMFSTGGYALMAGPDATEGIALIEPTYGSLEMAPREEKILSTLAHEASHAEVHSDKKPMLENELLARLRALEVLIEYPQSPLLADAVAGVQEGRYLLGFGKEFEHAYPTITPAVFSGFTAERIRPYTTIDTGDPFDASMRLCAILTLTVKELSPEVQEAIRTYARRPSLDLAPPRVRDARDGDTVIVR